MKNLFEEFANHDSVAGIVIGGSRATGTFDELSDWDIYIYTTSPIEEAERKTMLEPFVSYMEYGNTFWELEDDGRLLDGTTIELIYRDLDDFETGIHRLLDHASAGTGYTTCNAHHLQHGLIEYDATKRLEKLKDKLNAPYPQALKDAVIVKNSALLKDLMPSFYYQLEKAYKRNDSFSINHRMTELMASYFDIIYALNEEYHPGEKGLIAHSSKLAKLPEGHKETLEAVFEFMFQNSVACLYYTRKLIARLEKLIIAEGYDLSFARSEL